MNILITYFHQAFVTDNSEERKIANEISHLVSKAGYKVEILAFPFDLKESDNLKLIYSYNSLIIDNTSLLISINSPACYLSHPKHYSVWTKNPETILPKLLSALKTIFVLDKNLIKKIKDSKKIEVELENYSEIKKIFKKI